ncbi:MAG: hypothetical protein JXQ27_00975 [Acidobacteria bacterium]|nr:hypothetical protein [Acidobacteriota bacterium]
MTDEERYQKLYDSYCTLTEHRRRADPTFTIDDLRGLLASAYEFEGQDWAGHGEPKNTAIAARIAAYEHVLAEWERRLNEDKGHE